MWPCSGPAAKRRVVGEIVVVRGKPEYDFTQQQRRRLRRVLGDHGDLAHTVQRACVTIL